MKKLLSFACAAILGVALCTSSVADVVDNSGGGFGFPDNDPAGASSTITIGANEIITDVDVTLRGADHTWVGDMNVSLTSPGGTTADIMVRTGRTGGVGSGDSSDLGGDYTFSDGGADWWAAAAAAGGADVIASGTYGATTVDGALVSLAAAFAGESTAGTWTLTISDNAAGDLGDIDGWGLSITSAVIPEPGSLALLGIMGVACVVRRRR